MTDDSDRRRRTRRWVGGRSVREELPVPGEHHGLGTAAAVVGCASLILGILVVPALLLGGFPGTWMALRARRRVLDGDAANPRVVMLGFLTSTGAAALFVALVVLGLLGVGGTD